MNTDFLPKGYETPKSYGNYFSFEKGENRFRVLGSAIVGWVYWDKENKPHRSDKPWKTIPADARVEDGKQKPPKHFWAFPVWNYAAEKPQIMEVTQATIMGPMETLAANEKWGSPKGYDIVVKATGDGLEREYSVVPEPHSEAPKVDISNIFLPALYSGGDPFNATTSDGSPMPNFDNPPQPAEVTAEDFPEPTIS